MFKAVALLARKSELPARSSHHISVTSKIGSATPGARTLSVRSTKLRRGYGAMPTTSELPHT
ncbi:hypothetical protein C8K36_107129 [Rhodococcus sp. OK519]|nr:hypothetical protein C8K36_107129 [Rhodococcus sp. OK519]